MRKFYKLHKLIDSSKWEKCSWKIKKISKETQTADENAINLLKSFNDVKSNIKDKSNSNDQYTENQGYLTFGKLDDSNAYNSYSKSNSIDKELYPNKRFVNEMSLEKITEKDETLNQLISNTENDFSAQMEDIEEVSNHKYNNNIENRSTNKIEIFNRTWSEDFNMNSQDFKEFTAHERNLSSNRKSMSSRKEWLINSQGKSSNKTHEITQIQKYIEENKLDSKEYEELNISEYENRMFNDSWGSVDSIPLITQALRYTKENRNSIYTKLSKDREGRIDTIKIDPHFIAEESSIHPESSQPSYDEEVWVHEEFISLTSNRSN